ncbi:MAG: hypothetical protein HXK63_07760 [Campylobacter sp.]|nr:hypothetical protein [Campylobacter sp.]
MRGLNSSRSASSSADLSGENSVPRSSCGISSSENSAAPNSNCDAHSDTAASARQNSAVSDLSDKDRSGINSAASVLPLDFVNLSLGAQRWRDAGSTALAAIFAAFGVALAAMSIYCIIFIFDARAPAGLLALLILAPFAYCSFRFMRKDWRAAKFGRIFAALPHSKEPKRSGEAEGYASGVRVLQSGDVYYYGFALDGLYLSGDSKRRIVSDALRADQNLAELADG